MRKYIMPIIFSAGLLTAATATAEQSMQGAWVIESSTWDGESIALSAPYPVKIYSTENFMYTYHDVSKPGETFVGAGSYNYDEGTMTETIMNHSNRELIGEVFSFEITKSEDGDTFSQTLAFPDGTLSEVWRRLD
ncbi:MAG: Uncharacterised protein [Hyphomonas sp. TMED17]|nr:MAG: Uncharacterised protein [Hyphomonas sp. TMED17]